MTARVKKQPLGTQGESSAATVLLVDDDPPTRDAIKKLISPLAVNTLEANSGRQALNLLKKHHVDAVVSDLVMPVMSGMMLLHTMMESGFHVPFILVTGFSDKDSAVQALRLGAFDYLEKPLDQNDIRSVLAEAIKVSQAQRALEHQRIAQDSSQSQMAETQIMRMRALRHSTTQEPLLGSPSSGERSSLELREMFVAEAEPQLQFAEGALKSLPGSQPARDLAYVLRVVQSIRMASAAIKISDISDLAWSIESSVAALKLSPGDLSKACVDLLLAGISLLKERISALGRLHAIKLQQELDALAEELHRKSG